MATRLTQDGATRLQEELRELNDELIPDMMDRLRQEQDSGDVTDNAEYENLKEGLARLQIRVQEIEQALNGAEIIEEGSEDGTIGIGSHVTVTSDDGEETVWVLVSPEEADAPDGRLSTDSPVGAALLGSRAGDQVSVDTPDGEIVYTVTKVN